MPLASKRIRMSTAQIRNIKKALDLRSLRLPRNPRVAWVDWEAVEDSSGEESLEVFVLFDDRTTDRELQSAPVNEIKSEMMKSLAEHGVELFPYFTFLRKREHLPGGER